MKKRYLVQLSSGRWSWGWKENFIRMNFLGRPGIKTSSFCFDPDRGRLHCSNIREHKKRKRIKAGWKWDTFYS